MEFLPQHRDDALVRPAQRDVRHELAGDREVVDRGRLDGFTEGPEVVSGDGVRMAEEGEEFTQVLDAAARVRPVEAGKSPPSQTRTKEPSLRWAKGLDA